MIFRPELAEKVLSGEKRITRRPCKNLTEPCRYVEDRVYAVQDGRGRPARGYIRILEATPEPVGWIDLDDAQAEGFASVEEFIAYWRGLYGKWDPSTRVWRIAFALAEKPAAARKAVKR